MWREFSDTRWAASAGHLFGHTVISSETWTWLHSPAFRATPLDMKAEADLHFLQGINQLVGHGLPYSPPSAVEPGWRMYAAGAFNAHDPWWGVMPDLGGYLQRVSFALRQGKPANDVAILLPEDDAWASFHARLQQPKSATSLGGFDETGSNVTIDESMPRFLGKEVISQVLGTGFNFDFIDAEAVETVGIPYKVLVLPGVDRIPPSAYEKILAFARSGGIVIATTRLPAAAPGYRDALEITSRIKHISNLLFRGKLATAHFLTDERSLGTILKSSLEPDFETEPPSPQVGFIHRHLESGDLYFIANTGNQHRRFVGIFRASADHGERWDPFTGHIEGLSDPERVEFDLEPYESALLFFSKLPLSPARTRENERVERVDLSRDWQVKFGNVTKHFDALKSWTERDALRFYSGTATYEKTVEIPTNVLLPGSSISLDFGSGTAVRVPNPLPRFNMRAYLESPVREAAQVFVNDRFAGYVWHPPFRVEIGAFLSAGPNKLRIVVGNTAINELAGLALPDYRLLYSRYGVEFIPQDMDHLKPLASGILGPITLVERASLQ